MAIGSPRAYEFSSKLSTFMEQCYPRIPNPMPANPKQPHKIEMHRSRIGAETREGCWRSISWQSKRSQGSKSPGRARPALPSAWGLLVPIAVPLDITALEVLAPRAQRPWDPVTLLSTQTPPALGPEQLREPEPLLLPSALLVLSSYFTSSPKSSPSGC